MVGSYFTEKTRKKKLRISKARIFFYFKLRVLPQAAVTAVENMVGGFAGKKGSRGKARPTALGSLKLVFMGFFLAFHPFFFF